jgi:class 3 adenylate cyclase
MEGISKDAFRSLVRDARSKKPIYKSVMEGLEHYAMDSAIGSTQRSDLGLAHEEYSIQQQVRPSFGKADVNSAPIGAHPDFAHLANTTSTERHHVCSLFLDIKNSTRLSFLYDLDDVFWIKNLILRAASETVRAMDGHVHRFMGDALLAFFGGKTVSRDDSVINAINCSSVLQAMMERTIIPVLGEEGIDAKDIGFRIGLDYGGDDQVLWGSYGFSSVFEVTATSFYVDVAAKLQSMASKNAAMMGQSIIDVIDFPSEFVQKKKVVRDGESYEVDTLNKTYTDKNGNVTRYRVRELQSGGYRDLLPFPTSLKSKFPGSKVVHADGVEFKCFEGGADSKEYYPSLSRSLEKFKSLEFRLRFDKAVYRSLDFPLSVVFNKRNYGFEAQLNKSAGLFSVVHDTVVVERDALRQVFFPGRTIKRTESTQYRGLHSMEAIVKDAKGSVVFRDLIGVYIS